MIWQNVLGWTLLIVCPIAATAIIYYRAGRGEREVIVFIIKILGSVVAMLVFMSIISALIVYPGG